jgi:peptide/nickel transport system ATP-binding protein
MMQPLLQVDGLTVAFPAPGGPVAVVRDFSLTMGREKIGIVGESGSGKSMTARAILGLVRPPGQVTARTLQLEDTDLTSLSPRGWRSLRGKKAGMILQDPKFSLNPVKRIGNQIEETLRLHERIGRPSASTIPRGSTRPIRINYRAAWVSAP